MHSPRGRKPHLEGIGTLEQRLAAHKLHEEEAGEGVQLSGNLRMGGGMRQGGALLTNSIHKKGTARA